MCEQVLRMQEETLEAFSGAIDVGLQLEDPIIVANASVYIWNYFIAVFREGREKELLRTLEKVCALSFVARSVHLAVLTDT